MACFFGPFAAMGMRRFGSGQFSMISLVLMLPLLPLVGLAPSIFILGLVIFAIGAVDSVLDAAQNAHGLSVQRLYRRSIINNMHAFWALGTVAGALIGAITLALNFSLTWTLSFVAALGLLGALVTFHWVLPKNANLAIDQGNLADEIQGEHLRSIDPGSIAPAGSIYRFHIGPMLAAIGLLTVLAVIVEDVPQRWSSIYLTDLGVDPIRVGLGVVAFTISLTIGRFVGDLFVNRFGERLVAQVSMGITVSMPILAHALSLGLELRLFFPPQCTRPPSLKAPLQKLQSLSLAGFPAPGSFSHRLWWALLPSRPVLVGGFQLLSLRH